jgi:two-component system sensor histidine kinase TctE
VFDEVRIRDDEVHGTAVKVAYTWVKLGLPNGRPALVQVAETMEKRSVLATEIVKGVMLPQFVILPMAVLLVWLALVQAIKPLNQLEERIRARKPDDLSPIDAQAVPLEVVPLVSSVNDLLMRLKDSIATQKRFLADAAHQLKTPLAGLRMQADLAQREGSNAEELKQSLRQIGRSSIRATHTVNQLLALARAESSGSAMARSSCDLADLTMSVVRDCAPRAIAKHLDLGYEGLQPGSEGGQLTGNPTLLKELIRNLVDNAINYTPSSLEKPGVITARVLSDPFEKTLLLQVEDSGPGVPTAERELIFQPFYRALGTEADGSGLGLPIVLEIAHQHHASVTMDDTQPVKPRQGRVSTFALWPNQAALPSYKPARIHPGCGLGRQLQSAAAAQRLAGQHGAQSVQLRAQRLIGQRHLQHHAAHLGAFRDHTGRAHAPLGQGIQRDLSCCLRVIAPQRQTRLQRRIPQRFKLQIQWGQFGAFFKQGICVREFAHVNNPARGLHHCIQHPGTFGQGRCQCVAQSRTLRFIKHARLQTHRWLDRGPCRDLSLPLLIL